MMQRTVDARCVLENCAATMNSEERERTGAQRAVASLTATAPKGSVSLTSAVTSMLARLSSTLHCCAAPAAAAEMAQAHE